MKNLPGLAYHPTDEKIYKLESGLLNWWEADRYIINEECNYRVMVEDAIRAFPEGNLDILDAMFNGEQMGALKIPKPRQLDIAISSMQRPYANRKKATDIAEPYILY